jgi:mono/diheme cytochrome c family protein
VRTDDYNFVRTTVLIFLFALILGLGIMAAPFNGLAQSRTFSGRTPGKALIHAGYALFAADAATNQDAGQTAPPPATPPATAPLQPKTVELPEGSGKPFATEYCQDCHRLTNLTRAHKSLDDWLETLQTMVDRGARLPQENVNTLAEYLAKNFGPKTDTPAPDAPATPAPAAASPDAAPSAPAQAKKVELPEGDGKAIATENCQACHRLTNVVKAHKSLDDWLDTVQLMIDRGANIPADQIDTLVQYLAKNFGPKEADPGASTPSTGAAAKSSSQSQ